MEVSVDDMLVKTIQAAEHVHNLSEALGLAILTRPDNPTRN